MRYQLYKPNSKNAGCAASFYTSTNKDGSPCLFINFVLQSGWNDQSKTGSFKENAKNPQKSTSIKMNHNEAGEMLSSLKTRHPVNFFHTTATDKTQIQFSPWDKDRTVKTPTGDSVYKSHAFGLSVTKNSSLKFKIALEAGETEVLGLLLQDFINQCLFHEGNKFQSNGDSQAPSGSGELLGGQASAPAQEESLAEEDDSDVPF